MIDQSRMLLCRKQIKTLRFEPGKPPAAELEPTQPVHETLSTTSHMNEQPRHVPPMETRVVLGSSAAKLRGGGAGMDHFCVATWCCSAMYAEDV